MRIEDHSKARALEGYLVAQAQAGSRRAMAQLYELRGPRLLAHATRLLGEREAAQDLVQEAWVEIIRGLPRLRDPSAFLPWALRIASRRVARDIGRRQRDRALARDYAAEAETSTPAQDESPDAASVRAALTSLPPEQAATVALFYLEDLRVAEVAMAMDVPVGTVKTRLMHARARLRALLEGGESHEET